MPNTGNHVASGNVIDDLSLQPPIPMEGSPAPSYIDHNGLLSFEPPSRSWISNFVHGPIDILDTLSADIGERGIGPMGSGPTGQIKRSFADGELNRMANTHWATLRADHAAGMYPDWQPIDDADLDKHTAAEWYKTTPLPAYKEHLAERGYTEDYFRTFGTAREAKTAYETALFTESVSNRIETFNRNHNTFGSTMLSPWYWVASAPLVAYDTVTDPAQLAITLLTGGVGKAATGALERTLVRGVGRAAESLAMNQGEHLTDAAFSAAVRIANAAGKAESSALTTAIQSVHRPAVGGLLWATVAASQQTDYLKDQSERLHLPGPSSYLDVLGGPTTAGLMVFGTGYGLSRLNASLARAAANSIEPTFRQMAENVKSQKVQQVLTEASWQDRIRAVFQSTTNHDQYRWGDWTPERMAAYERADPTFNREQFLKWVEEKRPNQAEIDAFLDNRIAKVAEFEAGPNPLNSVERRLAGRLATEGKLTEEDLNGSSDALRKKMDEALKGSGGLRSESRNIGLHQVPEADLRVAFKARGKGHNKMLKFWDGMVAEGSMPEWGPGLLSEIFMDHHDDLLNGITLSREFNPHPDTATSPAWAQLTNDGVAIGVTPELARLSKQHPNEYNGALGFLHEYFHTASFLFLNDADRSLLQKVYASKTSREWAKIFSDQTIGGDKFGVYYAKNVDEWLVEMAARRTLSKQIGLHVADETRLSRIVDAILAPLTKWLKRRTPRGFDEEKAVNAIIDRLRLGYGKIGEDGLTIVRTPAGETTHRVSSHPWIGVEIPKPSKSKITDAYTVLRLPWGTVRVTAEQESLGPSIRIGKTTHRPELSSVIDRALLQLANGTAASAKKNVTALSLLRKALPEMENVQLAALAEALDTHVREAIAKAGSKEPKLGDDIWRGLLGIYTEKKPPVPVADFDFRAATAFEKARSRIADLVDERESLLSTGTPESQQRLGEITKELDDLSIVGGAVPANWNPPVGPTPPLPARTTPLTNEAARDALNATPGLASLFGGNDATPRVRGPLSFARRGAVWASSRLATNGIDATVWSRSPAIRRLTSLFTRGVLTTESMSGALKHLPTLRDASLDARANVGQLASDLDHVMRTNQLNLNRARPFFREAAEAINNGNRATSPQAAELQTVMENWLRAEGERGVRSNHFSTLNERYFPVFLRDHARAPEIINAFHAELLRRWSDPAADLNRSVLRAIGIRPGRNFDPTSIGLPAGARIRVLADLPVAYQTLYTNEMQNPTGILRAISERAIRKRMGLEIQPHAILDRPDAWEAATRTQQHQRRRSIEQDVWFTPGLAEFVDTNLYTVGRRYGLRTGYAIRERETMNSFLGRRDISFDQFWSWARNQVLNRLTGHEYKDAEQALRILETKRADLSNRRQIDNDGTSALWQGLGTAGHSLGMSAVSGWEPHQRFVTELVPILVRGALHPSELGSIVRAVIQMARHDDGFLAGLSYAKEQHWGQLNNMVYHADADQLYHFNWRDEAFGHPIDRIREAAAEPGPVAERVGRTAVATTQALSSVARAASGEDYMVNLVKMVEVGRQRTKLGRAWVGLRRLSSLLSAHTGPLTEEAFTRLANQAGVDPVYAARANHAGLLDPNVMTWMDALDRADPEFLTRTGNVRKHLRVETFAREVTNIGGQSEQLAAQRAYSAVNRFLEDAVDRLVIRPDAFDRATSPAAYNSPFGRMFNAFMSWQRAFFNKQLIDEMGNQPAHRAYAMFGFSLFLQALDINARNVIYRGYTREDLEEAWSENPEKMLAATAVRLNFLGPAQEPLLFAAEALIGLTPEQQTGGAGMTGGLVVSQVTGTFQSALNLIKHNFTDDGTAHKRDWQRLARVTPIINSWYAAGLIRAVSGKTLSESLNLPAVDNDN